MAKASSRSSVKRKPISSNHKGQPIHNEILRSLPRKEFDTVFAALEFVDLPVRTILNEPGEAITFCYFVNSGLVSILSVLSEGKSVEVGLTGKEGFVGLPLVVGLKTSGARAIVQIPASAFRINAAKMVAVLRQCPSLEKKLNRYAHALGAQSVQVAACNRLHEVDKRLARWLADVPGPGRRRRRVADAGVSWTYAGHAPRQCHRCGGDVAEGRVHHLQPGQGPNRQPG